ncbi:MAG: flagellar basal body rod protein FlgC [Desulfosalsimonadaceae bacterium]
MDVLGVMNIGYSALKAQTARVNVISSNLANMETTRTPEGGPYQKKSVIFTSEESGFARELARADGSRNHVRGVQVQRIETSEGACKEVYDPAHPDADEEGYVKMPDISLVEEMTDLMQAKGSYEANVTSIKAAQRMALKALQIGG